MPIFTGTAGNDTYTGSAGATDTAVISAPHRGASFSFTNGRWTVSAAGTDQLDSIEYVQFDDALISLTAGGLVVAAQNRTSNSAPVTTLANGSYVLAWQANTDVTGSTSSGVYFQVFSPAGDRVGTPILANTTTAGEQGDPAIMALSNGGFAIAWTSPDAAGNGVYVQQFDALGARVGVETRVNTTTADDQSDASIAAVSGGGFVVTWRSMVQDGSSYGVYTQLFSAAGVPVGAETLVNTTTTSAQYYADVQGLPGGGYVVAWKSDASGSSSVFLQRFASDGTKVGSEIAVDGAASSNENFPAIAATADGGFIVAFSAIVVREGVSYYTPIVQRFDAAGNKLGDAGSAATVPIATVNNPIQEVDVAVLSNGAFVVTWAHGSNYIGVQLFDAAGNKDGTEYRIQAGFAETSVSALQNGGFVVTAANANGAVQTLHFRADGSPVLPAITGDYLPNTLTASNNAFLSGGEGNDILRGSNSTGFVNGGFGDWLEGGAGADELVGGNGDDTYIADDLDRIVEQTGQGTDTVRVTASYTLTADFVENLTLTGSARGDLIGNSLANVITGNGADNLLNGGLGSDRMVGGSGNDTYVVDQAPDPGIADPGDVVIEEVGGGIDTVVSDFSYTLPYQVEILRFAGSANLNGTGNVLDNQLTGNAGDNRLDGLAGSDTLIGEDGNDTYVVDALDRVVETETGGYDTVEAAVSWTLDDNLERLVLTGTAVTNGTGNDLANVLVGNLRDNVLDGGAGADIMDGGEGHDTFIVDDAGDVASESNVSGFELVKASVTHTLGANIEDLTLTGTDLINGYGNGLRNTIRGNAADNVLAGGGGIDTLYGGSGNDTLISSDGLDALNGGLGNDTYQVNGSGDTITELTGQGADTVIANVARSYTLGLNLEHLVLQGLHVSGFGNTLANQITGTSGNNLLDGGAGADRLAGLGGNDTYVVDNASDLVLEDVGAGTDQVLSSITYTLNANVENLTLTGVAAINGTGNSSANRLTGNDSANTLNGAAGNDILVGGGGNDRLFGDDGADVFHGGLGNDVMDGGNEADTVSYFAVAGNVVVDLNITASQNTISAGNDTLIGIENLHGSNVGNDTLTGDASTNRIDGQGGNDVLDGGAGIDVVRGGEGADRIIGDLGNDTLDGGNGKDTLSFANAVADISVDLSVLARQETGLGRDVILNFEVVEGSQTGNDRLFGDYENNEIFGLGGNDVLGGDDGADILDGGLGNDTADYSRSYASVMADLGKGQTLNDGFGRIDTLIGIENLTGSELDDLLIGDGNANALRGLTGNDILEGRDGDDRIEGGEGDDRVDGGSGSDTAAYDTAAGGVTVNLGFAINDTISAGIDNLISIENLAGSSFADLLTGNAGANRLSGGDGDDIIEGALGDDYIDGGAGADTASYSSAAAAVAVNLGVLGAQNTGGAGIDTLAAIENLVGSQYNDTLTGNDLANVLEGGLGNDTLDGANGSDVASYASATVGVRVDLNLVGPQNTIGAGTDTLISIENLIGSNLADTLIGSVVDNSVSGGAGDDSISGGGGNDTLFGGLGNDRLDGGGGTDTASYADAPSAVTVDMGLGGPQDTGGAGSDTLVGIERLLGSAFDDTLLGSVGLNTLTGGEGDDWLFGRAGNDTLAGGLGSDRFYFDSALNATTNLDRIVDFDVGADSIYLSRAIFGAIGAGALSEAEFQTGIAAADASDRIIYDSATGRIFYDADGNGAAAAIVFTTVAIGTSLSADDFIGF